MGRIVIAVAVLMIALVLPLGCRASLIGGGPSAPPSVLNAQPPPLDESSNDGRPTFIMYAVGGLLILAAPVLWFFIAHTLGIVCAIAGGGLWAFLLFLERFLWAVWIPVGFVILLLCLSLWRFYQAERAEAALTTVVDAVEKSGNAATTVKANVAKLAGDSISNVRLAVAEAKARIESEEGKA